MWCLMNRSISISRADKLVHSYTRIMGTFSILFLLGCARLVLPQDSINQLLDEKLRQTKIEIAKLHFQQDPPEETKVYNVKWDQVWHHNLEKEQPFIANTYDKILLIEANRLVIFSPGESPLNRTFSQNITSSNISDSIKFVRSTVWKSAIYLLVCYRTGSCGIYMGLDYSQLRHRQTIQLKGDPMDASFFVRANHLYLVIAANSGQFAVPSLIYHWKGTYMDVIAEVMTIAAVSVTTFKYKQSIIIIFAQNDKNTPGIGSMVYEFKDSTPDRIQFLPTSNPTVTYHYSHAGFNFILFMDEHGPSSLFWWDGHELLNWQQIAEIQASNLVRIVNIIDETFFLVSPGNILQLYKFENASNCILVSNMKLPSEMTLVDIRIRVEKSTMIMVLVVMNDANIYSVESWELRIEEIPPERSTKESDILSKHFAEVIELLQERKLLVQEAEVSKSILLPINQNITTSKTLVMPNMILDSGTIKNIDIFVDKNIIAPEQLKEHLENLTTEVNNAFLMSKRVLVVNDANYLESNIIIDGDAFIEQLQIDKVDVNYFNDVDMHLYNGISSWAAQESSNSLKGDNIVIRDLQVDSICGIPLQYWSLNNNTSKMEINVASDNTKFVGNSVHLNSNVSLTNLFVETINGTNVNKLLGELFIIQKNKKIEGNITYSNTLQIQNLTTQILNGVPWEHYMNTKTDQKFDKFIIKKIQVENLNADSINGVLVSEAARVSTKNIIKGEIKIAKLQVTEQLIVDSNFKLPAIQQHQIYKNVSIRGNLKIGTLDMDKYSKIVINDEEINLNNITNSFWTKSTDQIIKHDIAFENHLVIDYLNTKYLNGFSEEEFLYTTATTIPQNFYNLHFENVHIEDMFFIEGKNGSFFDVAPESVTILEKLHLSHLHGNELFTNEFNGLLITDILSGKQLHRFPGNTNFSTIQAKRINVDKLNFRDTNEGNMYHFIENVTNSCTIQETMKRCNYNVENLSVKKINDFNVEKLLSLKNINISDLTNLIIDGDLIVKGDLQVDEIDNQPAITYMQNMVKENIVFDTKMSLDELIAQNITLKSLFGYAADDLFEGFLSKSKEQIIPGKYSFYTVTANNIDTRFINYENTSNFMWINEPLFLTRNVTFDNLFVEGDIITNTLNGRVINEVYQSLLNVSFQEIGDLRVDGNISWDVPSASPVSITFLFKNAVTKDTNQTIIGDTIFRKDVSASKIAGQWKEIGEIHDIIADAVIDDGSVIEVTGQKIFKRDLIVNTLSVTDDIGIPMINNISIVEFNNSVVKRSKNEMIIGSITFLEEVAMTKVLVNNDTHNVPFKGVVLATDLLPSHVHFKDLVVKDIYLKNLDGIDFDEFLSDRITIDGNHKILVDVQFNDIVDVTGNVNVSRINGIDPFDLVLNETEETQVISGSKIFEEHVIVTGNINAEFINGVNISEAYSNGIQNDEDVEIFGDLIFESKVKVSENVSVSNFVNEIKLQTILDDLGKKVHQTLQIFTQNETEMEEKIMQSSLISGTLRNIFSYLEAEERLTIQAPNIKKVDVVYYEQVTKLNMFGEEPGPLCGLPENCFCPTEYVAELDKQDCRIRRTNGTKIVRNYHELHSTFGVNVVTNTVSYSNECTLNDTESEFITISWMKSETMDTGDVLANVKETFPEIRGFIKDAEVFMTHDNVAFVILAVYYDTLLATHQTNSVIYKIEFETNILSIHQKLPTDGAWAIEIFKIHHHEIYLLLGCFGQTEKSFLYKLDAVTSKFTLLKTFGGKTRNVKSLFQEHDHFILLDNFDTNAINIFQYDSEFHNFHDYQSLFHDSRVGAVGCFYTDGKKIEVIVTIKKQSNITFIFHIQELGRSDTFITVVTENDHFYIYEYMYAQKFQLKVHHRIDDLQTMVPFHSLDNHYIFVGTNTNSTILRIVKQGPH